MAPLPERGLVRYVESLASELFAFQREAFPTRRADLVEPRWRWMFEASAARLGVEPMVWLYRSGGRILAHQGAIPVRLQSPAGECVTGWFVETMTLEEVRGKAIGPMLVAKALQELPFNLSLGQTEQMRELQYRLGWRQVAPVERLLFVLNGGALMAGKLPGPLAYLAGGILGVQQRLRHWRDRPDASPLQVRQISRFGADHDALWARVAPQFPVAVVRDASYLNWKYVDQPGQSFVRLELARDGVVEALAILSVTEPVGTYRYRRAWLIDVVVSLDRADVVWQTFEGVRQAARAAAADVIVFDVLNGALVDQAVAFGFDRREPTKFLLVAPGGPTGISTAALDPGNWLVTRGDSDLDRPW